MIRALIVDDEPHARDRLRGLLARETDVELLGECVDGTDALDSIRRHAPTLLFLDVQMPGLTGLQLLDALLGEHVPYLIFTTAHGQYAQQAFEVDAVDYLLKPFDGARLQRALQKARQRLATGLPVGGPDLVRLQQDIGRLTTALASRRKEEALTVHVGKRVRFLDAQKIRYIMAEGNYVRIAGDGEAFLARERIAEMEQRLCETRFLRIHRSVLINLVYLRELKPHEHGNYEFVLDNGESFVSSAAYREQVRAVVEEPHKR